jgi:hypothetical protein
MKSMSVLYSPPPGASGGIAAACRRLGEIAAQGWERTRLERTMWQAVKEACIAGDAWLYFYNSRLESQLVDNIHVYLADEQQADIQKQPYVILYERRSVREVRELARKNGVKKEEAERILPDEDTANLPGDAKNEVRAGDGKCACLLYLEKKDGAVHFTRATKTVVFLPETRVQGMTMYPLAGLVWLSKKGSARGNGEVSQLIPNQIECNRLLARRVVNTKLHAFAKPVYSETAIANPEDVDKIGTSLAVRGPAGRVADAFTYVAPAPISADARLLQQELIEVSQRMSSAGSAALGNVDPERASGAAIIAARDQAAIPLNEQTALYRQFVEDIARIWLDMTCAYSPDGIETEDGRAVSVAELREAEPRIRVDVSPADPYSKFAQEESLQRALAAGHIDFAEYVQALDDDAVAPKAKLEAILKKRDAAREAGGTAGQPDGLPGPEAAGLLAKAGLGGAGVLPGAAGLSAGGPPGAAGQ